ncbi:hypothetical protein KY363_05590 [Candidatus Woesearchaeota archaeon]|nr:hypothetical protein [Candidatus Woesearchaeota archaeon]
MKLNWINKEVTIDTIVRQAPFRTVMHVKEVRPLDTHGGSGQVFQVISTDAKGYKLRYCKSLGRAREIERSVKKFPKAFPRFYGREGKYLLFDWIDDAKHLTEGMSAEESYRLGKLFGELHELNEVVEDKSKVKWFESSFKHIRTAGVFDEETFEKLERRYHDLKKKLRVDIVLDYVDSKPFNFMIERKTGRVYFVDEDGLMHGVKAFGLPNLMRMIKDGVSKDAFWKGYKEHHSNDYFDKDYEEYTLILSYLFLIGRSVKKGLPPPERFVEPLKKLIM